jgi:transglutaminase-like putative cysteine protease
MRLKVRHHTAYAYEQPARFAMQMLRMTPRSHEGQFVRRWRVEVDADARLDRGEDAFGNITRTIFIDGPVEAVTITVEGEVDTIDTAGFVRGTAERLPVPLFLRETALTRPSEPVRAFARDIAGTAGDPLATLHRLMQWIGTEMAFEPGATAAATTAAEAFAARHGVCQDFAHVFIAAARSLGIPARYVSGYYFRTDGDRQDAGHAWAEAHVDGLGWIGFDPANGTCVTDRYVRVAAGPDYLEAAPVRGSQTGGSAETLAVAVYVAQGQHMARTQSQSQSQS